jgi:hypothetical protein
MTVAILSGVSSGALHAVTGPDHLLSLGPAALQAPRRAGRIGLIWGVGHALGTLLLSLPLLVLAQLSHMNALASAGNRLSGLALLLMAAWSWQSSRRSHAANADTRSPLWVGLAHGVTGAGALLLVLPSALTGDVWRALAYLLAFAAGSTLAMAAFTRAIGRVGHSLDARRLRHAQRALLAGAVTLGGYWLAFG